MSTRLLVILLVLGCAPACHDPSTGSQTVPIVGPTPIAPAARAVVEVVDGWTGAPVAGTRITLAASTHVTDAQGRAEVPLACERATFAAEGFLERRVNCLVGAALEGRTPITLWPVANDEERRAVRQSLFIADRLTLVTGNSGMVVGFADTIRDRAEVESVFQAAAARIGDLTGGRVRVPIGWPPSGGDGYVVSEAAAPPCASRWFTWTFAVAGFCGSPRPSISWRKSQSTRRASPDVTSLFVCCLYGWGMRQHDAPGLLNATAPAADLTEFERRSLHMASLRRAIVWPDYER